MPSDPRTERGRRVGVVLPAGGSGQRMAAAGEPAKQFRELGGAPLVVHTARAFRRYGVGSMVVVVPAGEEGRTRAMLAAHGVEADVAAGGASRQASVARGVRAVEAEVVVVHDAVRPFVTQAVIGSVVEAAAASGASAAALPVADTLRQGGAGPLFGETVSRDGLWSMQTPQAARRDWLLRAAANSAGHVATDEVGLLQHAGYPVRIVPGDPRTFKVTHPPDWRMAQALWPAWETGGE